MSTIKKIDAASPLGAENNLNLFDLPASNVAINRSIVRELLPLAALNQTGPYTFRLFQDQNFVDLSQCWFYLASAIERKQADGSWAPISTNNEADKNIGVIQNFGHSFIKTLKISINGVECFDSGIWYAHRAYILHELGYSHETRRGLHESNCYYLDDNNQDNAENEGFQLRAARFAKGKVCETMVKLSFDLARQENYLISETDLIFTIYRNSDEFLLLQPDYKKTVPASGSSPAQTSVHQNNNEYRIKIHDMRLYVKTIDVYASMSNAISKQLQVSPAKYALRKIEMRSVFVGKGRTEINYNVFSSVVPRRLIIGFVSNDRLSNLKKSPFLFEHANLRSISAEANGQTFLATPYIFQFNQNQHYIRAFVDLYVGLGLDEGDRTISLNFSKFLNGWCFFVIPMTSTLNDTPGFELIRNSTTCIRAQFSDPIKDEGFDMFVLGEFDAILSINADRVLQSDSSVV